MWVVGKPGYKRDPEMSVPGTPRSFLRTLRDLNNSAAPAAAHLSPGPGLDAAGDSSKAHKVQDCCSYPVQLMPPGAM